MSAKPANQWEEIGTGGGCTALELMPRRAHGLIWLITDGDCSAPENPDDKCLLGLHDAEGHGICYWDCACLAEAKAIAEGAYA